MAEWDTPGKKRNGDRRGRPVPEPARETDALPEMHPEQHWAPWETPSRNPGRVTAERIPTPDPDQDQDEDPRGHPGD